MAFTKFTKDPDAVLDYEWDWTPWLTAVSDSITSATFTPDEGITVEASSHSDMAAIAWISGGTAPSCNVKCHIVTAGGREDDRTYTFLIKER